jgi:nucleoside-diphosphate-sugar epimerase
MRLLVTGGSGFLGRYVLAEAGRRGHSCVALARSPEAARTVAALGATPLAGDLDDGAALAGLFARAGCDALVNLASLGFGHAPGIVGAAVRGGLDRAVFISTTAVMTTLPARSKALRLAAEDEIHVSGLSWTILRPTMIYGGPGDRNLSRLLALLARLGRAPLPGGLPLVVPVPGGGRHLQQPVHAADLAGAVLTAVERREAAGRRYDVAGPEPLTFADVLRAAAAAVGGRAHVVPVPLAPVIAVTRGYERLSRRPRVRAEQWQRLAEDKAFPIEAAARDLGYAPRSFADGIRAEAVALGLTSASPPSPPPQQPPAPPPCSTPGLGIARDAIATLTRRSHAFPRQEPARPRPRSARAVARPGPAADQLLQPDALSAEEDRHAGDHRSRRHLRRRPVERA